MRTLQAAPRFFARSSALAPMLPPGDFASYGLAAGVPVPPNLGGPGLETTAVTRAEMVPALQALEPHAAGAVIVHNLTAVPVPLPPPDGVSTLWLSIDGQPVRYGPGQSEPPSSTGRTLLYLGVGALALYALTSRSER